MAETATELRATRPSVMPISMTRRLTVEFIGTFWVVLGGCGSAVLAATMPAGGIGPLGVALAFGLTVLTMVYALGHISGGHFNPAVTAGAWAGGRFAARDAVPYVLVQVAGAIAAAGVVLYIANGRPGYSIDRDGLAANGYGAHSPGGYGLGAALVVEILVTAAFVLVILGVTRATAPRGFQALAIGLALTLTNLVAIPVTAASVNPARSTGPALFVGGWALSQLWLFWLAPIVGGLVAGLGWRALTTRADEGLAPAVAEGAVPVQRVRLGRPGQEGRPMQPDVQGQPARTEVPMEPTTEPSAGPTEVSPGGPRAPRLLRRR